MKNKSDLKPGEVRNFSNETLIRVFLDHVREPLPLISDALMLLKELESRGFNVKAGQFDEDDCPLCVAARVDIVARRLIAH